MTPLYDLNSPPSPFPLEINLNQQYPASASSSSAPHLAFFNNIPDQQPKPYHLKVIDHMTHDGGSRDHQQASSSSSSVLLQSATVVDFSLSRKEGNGDFEMSASDDHEDNGSSLKWMSSKMRIMKKIIIHSNCSINIKPETNKLQCPFLDTHDETNSTGNAIRVCSDCNTTTTPLWRSGPRGPKSLCNACGIRQRKARRALEVAAAAVANGEAVVKDATACLKIKVQKKKKEMKKTGTIHVGEYKKQLKMSSSNSGNNCVHQMKKKLCLKELGLSSLREKNSGMQQRRRGCPQDVEDAAILLMELSCGLIHT